MIGLIAVIAFVVLYFLVEPLLDSASRTIGGNDDGSSHSFYFYHANFEEDIYKDATYMGLDRSVYYTDLPSGFTTSLDAYNYTQFGEAPALLFLYIHDIIEGNCEAYDSYFSEAFLKENKRTERFTKQKLYNIKIVFLSAEESAGGAYTTYEFAVEYMIHQNNGTFRRDLGSDCTKKQHFVLTDKSGRLLIESVGTYTN